MDTTERWRPVLGFEDRYEISNHGRICSLVRKTPRLMHPGTGTHGYLYVLLRKGDGKKHVRLIHRLVVEAFIGPISPKMDVNHKDGQKKFNHIENLETMSRSENQLHAFRVLHRTIKTPKGSEHGASVLTEKQVLQIRASNKGGASLNDLTKQFLCSKSAIAHIVKRRSWTHI